MSKFVQVSISNVNNDCGILETIVALDDDGRVFQICMNEGGWTELPPHPYNNIKEKNNG